MLQCVLAPPKTFTQEIIVALRLVWAHHIISNKHIKREKSKLFQNTIIKNRNAVDKAKEK